MKNSLLLYFSILFSFFLLSCSTEEDIPCSTVSYRVRTVEEVEDIAKNAYNAFFGKDTRGNGTCDVKVSSVQAVRGKHNRGGIGDTLLYVVNFEEEKGFALISPTTSTDALIGISDEGNYSPDDGTPNENFQAYINAIGHNGDIFFPNPESPFWVDSLNKYYYTPTSNDSAGISIHYDVIDKSDPQIEYKWGPGYPYGMYCKNGKANCKSVAMAMVIAHFDRELEKDGYRIRIPKSLAVQHIGNRECSCGEDEETVHDAIARAMRDLDKIAERYQNAQSISGLMDSYYYHTDMDPFELPDLGFLKYDKQVVCFAYDQTEDGHLWIVDGYKTLKFMTGQTKTYLHYNWGYNGECNGYFHPGVLKASGAFDYDDTHKDFNYTCSSPIAYQFIRQDVITGM